MITNMEPTGFDGLVATLAVSDAQNAAAELRTVGHRLFEGGGLARMRAAAWNAFGMVQLSDQVRFGQALNAAWDGVGGWPGKGT